MLGPSPMILVNTIDLYRLDTTRAGAFDADGALVPAKAYPSSPNITGIPCRVCLEYRERMHEDHGRVSDSDRGVIIFDHDPEINLGDKIVWQGSTMFADGYSTNMAGSDAAWGVPVSAVY